MLSVLIPARNEKYLEPTIRNILKNARGDVEVLVALDGWEPEPFDVKDERAVYYPFKEAVGQRQSINFLAKQAKGKYVMKLDAHCAVDEGFDVKLAKDCKYEWTIVPRMYNLDIEKFEPKRHRRTDYMYFRVRENGQLRAEYYGGQDYKKWHRRKQEIDDTMCCMGPGWFLHKDRFLETGGCDEGHGGWGQQGVEVACKAWLSGGALKVNKKTWFSHWFRGGTTGPGFPYPLSGRAVSMAREYSKDLWLNDKWPLQKRSYKWLLTKFEPPGWDCTPDVSVIIPSYKDPMLHKTIEDILENFTGSYEVIPVIDGYKLEEDIVEDPRVRPIILEKNGGMRNAINTGVKAARGKFLMRADEHCMFAPGFDLAMINRIHRNWILTARRYYLDPYEWRRMDELGYIDYEKLILKRIGGKHPKFSGVSWRSRDRKRHRHRVDETMAMQGSMWMMTRKWWDKVIGELQTEGYGPHYQDSTEMVFKTWLAGGKLMVNKNTWFAHRWKRFNRTHYYPARKAAPEWKYALDKWKDEYQKVKKKWGM